MAAKALMCVDDLRQLISYNPETGLVTWAYRHPGTRGNRIFNGKFGGKDAGSHHNAGYTRICIRGVTYLAHRVAWAFTYNEEPPEQIDHINGDRSDNRISNLRAANYSINAKNRAKMSRNTSGFSNVSWSKAAGKWQAMFRHHGELHYVGLFETPEEAGAAVNSAKAGLGYSERHGT